jgi:hypothetical protein
MPIRNVVTGNGRGDIEERRKEGMQRLLYMAVTDPNPPV